MMAESAQILTLPAGEFRLQPNGDRPKRILIVDAAVACLAKQGLKKTSVEEIAASAGVSRATLYRIFPGGREAVLTAVVETELARFFSRLAVAMGSAESMEEVLVAGIHHGGTQLLDHPALQTMMVTDPEIIISVINFEQLDHTIATAATFAEPFFTRWLEPNASRRAAEFAVRVMVSHLIDRDQIVDLTSEASVRTLVRGFVLPGVEALKDQE